jgi:hypothetical protein
VRHVRHSRASQNLYPPKPWSRRPTSVAAGVARCVSAPRVRYHFASRATPLKRRSVGRRRL